MMIAAGILVSYVGESQDAIVFADPNAAMGIVEGITNAADSRRAQISAASTPATNKPTSGTHRKQVLENPNLSIVIRQPTLTVL